MWMRDFECENQMSERDCVNKSVECESVQMRECVQIRESAQMRESLNESVANESVNGRECEWKRKWMKEQTRESEWENMNGEVY